MKIVKITSNVGINITTTGVTEPMLVSEVIVNLDNLDGFSPLEIKVGENKLLGVAIIFSNMKIIITDIVDIDSDVENTKYDFFVKTLNDLDSLRTIDTIKIV